MKQRNAHGTGGWRGPGPCPETEHAEALVAELRAQYRDARVLPDGSVALLVDLVFTRAIALGATWDGYGRRFCFQDKALADQRFADC